MVKKILSWDFEVSSNTKIQPNTNNFPVRKFGLHQKTCALKQMLSLFVIENNGTEVESRHSIYS